MTLLIDKCKNCGCTMLEHKYCSNNNFYRYIDDKSKMKENLKAIRIHRAGFLQYYKFDKESIHSYFDMIRDDKLK